MTLYLRVISYIKPYWRHLSLAIFLSFLFVVLNNLSLWIAVDFIKELFSSEYISNSEVITEPSALPVSLGAGQSIYNKLNTAIRSVLVRENRVATLKMVCFVIFITFFLKNIVHYIHSLVLNYIEVKIVVNLRRQLHRVLIYQPLRFFDRRHTAEMTSVVFNDVNAINNVLHQNFGKMITAPVQILTNIVILFLISWRLSLFSVLVIPVSGYVIIKIGQGMRRRSRKVFQQIADVMSSFQEAMSGMRIVKAFSSEQYEIKRFAKRNDEWFKKTFRANKLKFATSPLNELLLVLIVVGLLWYGGNQVYANTGIAAEDFIRFLIFLFAIFQPIKDFSGFNNVIQNGMAAAERIFQVLDQETEPVVPAGAEPVLPGGFTTNICFEQVSFSYNSGESRVLDDVNLDIKAGQLVAFVGPSGAGKSTLLNLLPRFYEPDQGRILIDGKNIREMALPELRSLFGIVTQDTILFNESIRMNILYGRPEATEPEIIEAAKAAHAWEFIRQMEQGLDTVVGEKGARLSGGQKQRLSIARAILKNPAVLIFDEATSSLDTESERLVQQAIEQMHGRRTVLVIAHRLSTVQHADNIVVMKDGRVADTGGHNDLLSRSPLYRNLYENQVLKS